MSSETCLVCLSNSCQEFLVSIYHNVVSIGMITAWLILLLNLYYICHTCGFVRKVNQKITQLNDSFVVCFNSQ